MPNVTVDVSDRIATITINRPEARNALDRQTVTELKAHLDELRERDDAGAVIITGAGDQVFVAGADIRQLRERRRADALMAINASLFTAIDRFDKLTIAAVNGHALGGGCELALACDLRVAADHARLGQPEVGLGIIPAAGATQRLPRLIGLGRAKQLVLTGDPIDAPTALAWGLVTGVVPGAELQSAARALAKRVLERGPLAIRLAKMALNASARVDLDSGMLMETLAQAILFRVRRQARGHDGVSGEEKAGVQRTLSARGRRAERVRESRPRAPRGRAGVGPREQEEKEDREARAVGAALSGRAGVGPREREEKEDREARAVGAALSGRAGVGPREREEKEDREARAVGAALSGRAGVGPRER